MVACSGQFSLFVAVFLALGNSKALAEANAYEPAAVEWGSVVQGCKALDLSLQEVVEHFTLHNSQKGAAGSPSWLTAVQQLAAAHGASVADTLAVCGATQLHAITGQDLIEQGLLHLGRLDAEFGSTAHLIADATAAAAEKLAALSSAIGVAHPTAGKLYAELVNAHHSLAAGADGAGGSAEAPLHLTRQLMLSSSQAAHRRLLQAAATPKPPARKPAPKPSPKPSPKPAPKPVSTVQPRIEINEIDKRPQNDRYRSLLILAWKRVQDTDPNDPESNYQLSGIHGAPYVAFNGSYGAGMGGHGYCWHSSVLFPSWHRPYTLLFERVLIKRAKEVAASFVNSFEREKYVALAPTIRLPYWDWANPYNDNGDFPQLFVTPTVRVVNPRAFDASLMIIDNPLYQFVLPAPVDSGSPWPSSIASGQATVRDPSNNGAEVSDEQGFMQSVQGSAASFASQIYNLLGAGSWDCLYSANCGLGVIDLESIHNTLHGTVGGNMGVVPASGFDPVFWMHHAQIDRIFWLWQQRWPDVWLPPTYEATGNFYTPGGQTYDASTELTPFWRDQNGYFTSNDVQYPSKLGYYYKAPAGGNPDPAKPPPPAPPAQQGNGGGFGNLFSFFGRRRLQGSDGGGSSGAAQQGVVAVAAGARRLQGASSSSGGSGSSSSGSSGAEQQGWAVLAGPTGEQQAGVSQWKEAMRVSSRGYSGYRWQVNFAGVDKQQLGAPFYIHLFVAKLYRNGTSLRNGAFRHPGYCGNFFQLSASNSAMHKLTRPRIDVTIDVTSCLQKAGISTTFAPKLAGKPASGPTGRPAGLKDFVWVATTPKGVDVSKKFNFGAPKLTWSAMVDGSRLHVGSA